MMSVQVELSLLKVSESMRVYHSTLFKVDVVLGFVLQSNGVFPMVIAYPAFYNPVRRRSAAYVAFTVRSTSHYFSELRHRPLDR